MALIPNRFYNIEAKPSVQYFYQEFFTNPRYSQIAYFLWDIFRNPLAHLSTLKKIVNVPIDEIENSFLAGAHISGSTIERLEIDKKQKKLEEGEHLQFDLKVNKKGIKRPIFRFSPIIYYFDLKEAMGKYQEKLSADEELRDRFDSAYPLLEGSMRLDFQNEDRVPKNESTILANEIRDLIG